MMTKYIVRHSAMNQLGVFESGNGELRRGTCVLVRSERGHEVGDLLCESTPRQERRRSLDYDTWRIDDVVEVEAEDDRVRRRAETRLDENRALARETDAGDRGVDGFDRAIAFAR